MDEYIKRKKALDEIVRFIGYIDKDMIYRIQMGLTKIPAADVVEVVRCRECKHCVELYDTDGNAPYWTCKEWDSGTDYNGYCHYGKCKDGGKDDV